MRFPVIRTGRCLVVSILVLCLLLSAGCDNKGGLGPMTFGSVKGNVTLDGAAPPAGCQIVFTHQEKSLPAQAEIGSDGSYTLMFNGKPEIPTGSYDVTIVPPQSAQGPVADPANPESYKTFMSSRPDQQKSAAAAVVPPKYLSATTSGLTCTVLEGQEAVFDVTMVSGGQ